MRRELSFSGSFYPESIDKIEDFIERNTLDIERVENLRGIVVPHAGWIYSGEVALSGFTKQPKKNPNRVILIGPSHRVPFKGLAITNFNTYKTPFGDMDLDVDFYNSIIDLPGVRVIDDAHIYEHSLEVQLPFIKHFYPKAMLIPLVAGSSSDKILSKILRNLDNDIFIICSSDLSHYNNYIDAIDIDSTTIRSLTMGDRVTPGAACGSVVLNSLSDFKLKLIKYCNSGDTAGDRDRVVGYCSMEILNG